MSEALYAVAKKPRIMCCIQDSEDVQTSQHETIAIDLCDQ